MADRIQAVGERHAGRVMLLEVGKAARHRMAAGIDDPGIGKRQADEAEIHPIGGKLVDEARPPELAERAGADEIFLADAGQGFD